MHRELLLLAAAVLLWPVEVSAGWQRQIQGANQNSGYLDLWAVSPTFAAAVGVQGKDTPVVMITKNGETWERRLPYQSTSPLDIQFYTCVYFIDEKNGFVCGLGMIFATTDGGDSWKPTNLGGLFSGPINEMHSAAPASGVFAVTSSGEVRRTTDGKTWPVLATPLGEVSLNKVVFVDADHGWVAAGSEERDDQTDEVTGYKNGGLAHTSDGGQSWTTLFSEEPRAIKALSFVDASHGWMVSHSQQGSKLEVTVDGGTGWTELSFPKDAKPGAISSLVSVHFFDRCEGWLMGSTGKGGTGVLWHTEDGGSTWVEVEDRAFLELGSLFGLPIVADLIAFHFVDRQVGWAGGNFETIFRYTADTVAPSCAGGSGDGDGDGDSGGEGETGCSCAVSAAAPETAGDSGWLLACAAALVLWLRRRGSRASPAARRIILQRRM